MMKLNFSRENSFDPNPEVSYELRFLIQLIKFSNFQSDPNNKMICPLKIDMYCNNGTETALHVAIKGKHYDIVFALLKAGASVNTVIKPYHDINEVSTTQN